MAVHDDEDERLRSVALQNAHSILAARQRAEEALRKQSEWLRITLASIGDGVISTDAEGRVTFVNVVAEALIGWGNAEAEGKPLPEVFQIVNEETRKPVENPALRALEEGTIVGLANHTILISQTGTEFPIDDSAAPIRDDDGNLVGSVLVFRDITQRKQNQEELRKQQEWLRVTLESIGDAVIATDAEGRVVVVNRAAEGLTGWTQKEAENELLETVFKIYHEESKGEVENPVSKVVQDGLNSGLGKDTILIAKDGTERPIDDSAAPIRDASGKIVGAVLIFRDVTEQRRGEREIRTSEARNRAILETSLDCIITMDHKGNVVEFNPAAERTFGFRREDAIGKELAELIIPPSLRERHRQGMAHYLATGEGPVLNRRLEITAVRADGTAFPIELAIIRISLDGPAVFTAYLRDITERTRAEQYRAARLAFTQVLSQATSVEESTSGALAAVCKNLGWDYGAFWIQAPDGQSLRLLESWHRPDVPIKAFEAVSRALTFRRGEGLPGRVWASGASAWVEDVLHESNFPRLAPAASDGVHAAFACPVIVSGETIGVIEFFSKEIRDPDSHLLELMNSVCGQLAQFIERHRAQGEVREREQELSDFFENATVGLHLVGPDGIVLRVNRAELELLGYRREEYVGRAIADFHADEAVISDILDRLKAGEKLKEYPARLRCKDGSIKDVLIDSSVLWKDGKFVHTRCFTRDVTERRAAEAKLREQERRTSTILESISDAFVAFDQSWRHVYVNRQAEHFLGRTREDLLGKSLWEEFPATLDSDFGRYYRAAVAENVTKTFETFYAPHDRWYEVHAFPSPDGLAVYFRDASERRRAEAALRESEEKLRLLANTIPQLAWMAHPDGYIFWYNERWYDYTGTTPEEMEGWGWQSVHDPAVLPDVLTGWKSSIESGEPFSMVFPLKGGRDQKFHPFLTRVNPLKNEKGRVLYWFGTNTDISEQMEAQEALRQREAQQRFLSEVSAAFVGSLHYQSILGEVANLTVPVLGDFCFFDLLSDDGRLERLNWRHVDPEKTHLRDQANFFGPDQDAENHPVSRSIRAGMTVVTQDISDAWLQEIAASPEQLKFLRDLSPSSWVTVPMSVGNRRLGAFTVGYSVSGRRYGPDEVHLAEEIARRAALTVENAKLYDVLRDTDRRKDEFLATLAHELRNPLAPIGNSLQILKMPRVDPEVIQQTRDTMERQLTHLVRLVDDLMDVSRVMRGKIELRKERIELSAIVARAVEMVQPVMDLQAHQLSVSLPTESLLLDADPVRLTQVVSNLLNNAAKYTEPRGRIWVRAERAGDRVLLRVQDTGIGIAPQMLTKVFNLFVQAHHAAGRAQGGLGIGLTLAKNLVEMHGGTVTVKSAGLGTGSEFTVFLPLSAEKGVKPDLDRHDEAQPSLSGYRLLVVDDNQDAANTFAILLRLQGHQVWVAYDGPSALTSAQTYRPHLIFLDIGMPGMDGYEVARRLRLFPEQKKVLLAALTGWGQAKDRRQTAEAGFDFHLVKPPEPESLEVIFAAVEKIANQAGDDS